MYVNNPNEELEQASQTVDSVHNLQRPIRIFVFESLENEVHVGCSNVSTEYANLAIYPTISLVCKPESYQCVKRER